jgi:predicted nucleic acid-binding protein
VSSTRSLAASNAGPLIHLARINRLHLLKALFKEVTIPTEVKVETVDKGRERGFPDALQIEKAINEGWIRIEKIEPNRELTEVAKIAGLQLAEVAVIYYACRNRAIALLDDEPARVFARTLGVSVRGSLGIILDALKKGFLSRGEALEALDKLSEVMYLAPYVYRLVKKEIERE